MSIIVDRSPVVQIPVVYVADPIARIDCDPERKALFLLTMRIASEAFAEEKMTPQEFTNLVNSVTADFGSCVNPSASADMWARAVADICLNVEWRDA